MIATVVDILSWICLLGGGFFVLAGGIGVLRLPDFYTRIHAAGVTDTMGAWSILLGLALQAGWSLVTVKLGLIFLFLFFTSPTAAHALAKAALHGGLRPLTADDERHRTEDPSSTNQS